MSKQATFFTTCNGEQVSLSNTGYMSVSDAAKYRGLVSALPAKTERFVMASGGGLPTVYDYAVGKCACGQYHFAERRIERPSMASDHKCDGRCMNSKGRICECSCKGKNHGAGN